MLADRLIAVLDEGFAAETHLHADVSGAVRLARCDGARVTGAADWAAATGGTVEVTA